jgi:pimeloyl-ACP methyl ester carboxylesterase
VSLVETETLQIEVEVAGPAAGPAGLLLHGWPDAPRGWRGVAPVLHSAGWRTIAPCLRGTGGTRFISPDTPRDAQT